MAPPLSGLQVCAQVLLPDLPETGSVSGAHQDSPRAADLPLSPLQQGVPLSVWTGSPPVLPLFLPAAEHAQGNHILQVSVPVGRSLWLPMSNCAGRGATVPAAGLYAHQFVICLFLVLNITTQNNTNVLNKRVFLLINVDLSNHNI